MQVHDTQVAASLEHREGLNDKVLKAIRVSKHIIEVSANITFNPFRVVPATSLVAAPIGLELTYVKALSGFRLSISRRD